MKQKWSKEKILQDILKLSEQNIDLSAGNVSKRYITLFSAAISRRYFSNWENAVKAAGFDYGQIMEVGKKRRRDLLAKWSREQVLTEIRGAKSQDLLKIYRDRMDLYSAARRIFGTWEKALAEAGYRLTKGSHKNSNQIFPK
jgi:hypothetical protein